MYVITGATGNTGKIVAETLLAKGEKVRVLGRSAEKLQLLVAKGAEACVADVTDEAALTKAFTGATAVYAMIPPDMKAEDPRAHQVTVGRALAGAIGMAGVKHVVFLSSVGAQNAEGCGPVSELHAVEEMLNGIAGASVMSLRPAYFMENFLMLIGMIKNMGMMGGVIKADIPLPVIATRDIGPVAAEALLRRDWTGNTTRELLGQRDITMAEAAKVLGAAIGKPRLSYNAFPGFMAKPALTQMGLSKSVADALVEMSEAINDRRMVPLEKRSSANTTPTSIEWFTENVFAPAFQASAAKA
ncbi:MAG: NmrA family NAD(P)-binding protein [Acidobacteria bacterium]|nr:NmrA family NAD(P)-binding protein [Acidobacteriota bacterium]MBI3663649.1 NmrA family NAD(P)-binding protein [Acidobacteriota bacterium]